MSKRATKWTPEAQTASGAVLGCKKDPKRALKWTSKAHKFQYGSKGCQDEAQGRPNLRHELLQSKTCIRDSSGTRFMSPKGSHKGPQMDPKWNPKTHTFSNLFVHQFGAPFGTRWGPKWNQLETQQHEEDKGKDDMRERKNDGKTLEKQHIRAIP